MTALLYGLNELGALAKDDLAEQMQTKTLHVSGDGRVTDLSLKSLELKFTNRAAEPRVEALTGVEQVRFAAWLKFKNEEDESKIVIARQADLPQIAIDVIRRRIEQRTFVMKELT